MLNVDVISIYILTLALLAMVFGVIVNHRQKNGKTVSIWFVSVVLGLLLGASGALGFCYFLGYEVVEQLELPDPKKTSSDEPEPGREDDPAGRESRGGGPRRGSSRQAPARSQLAMLVRKIDLLTGDIVIHWSEEQAQQLHLLLKEIEAAETLSNEDAKRNYDALLALMEDSQRSKTEAVSLPVRNRRGGENASAGQDETNPFRDGSNANAIQALLRRLGGDEIPGGQ